MNLRVDNLNLEGLVVRQLPGLDELDIVISRILPVSEQEVRPVRADTVLHCGDRVLAVGTADKLAEFKLIVGSESDVDLMQAPGQVTYRRLVVTLHLLPMPRCIP